VGPAVNAARRERRVACADERGANVSYETLDMDEEEGGLVMDGGDASVDAIVTPL
jgi:hypothetical protein